jgi:hypothetical protein
VVGASGDRAAARIRNCTNEEPKVKQTKSKSLSLSKRFGLSMVPVLLLGLLAAAPAWAGFSQVSNFTFPSGAAVMAANSTGAGGVPSGRLYRGETRYTAQGTSPEPLTTTGKKIGLGMAVDQATGDIYAIDGSGSGREVNVLNPDGTQVLTTFGQLGAFGEKVEDGPQNFHDTEPGGMAVTNSGIVYVADSRENVQEAGGNFETRIMSFEPATPGDYEHYVYAGRSHDIIGPQATNKHFASVAVDDAGNIYVSEETRIAEYEPGSSSPICETPKPTNIVGFTVDARTGEVFYYNRAKRVIIQLNPCNDQGELTEAAEVTVVPKPLGLEPLEYLAFDPEVAYSPSRLPGILYGSGSGKVYIFGPAEAVPPTVESESVSAVTAGSAVASATINPKGTETHYALQFVTQSAYEENGPLSRFAGAAEVPAGGGLLGTGTQPISVSNALAGLLPDTRYHLRVVATSHCNAEEPEVLCEGAGADTEFETYPAENGDLPDGRAYEMVSPSLKEGGEVLPAEPVIGRFEFRKPGAGGASYPKQSAPDGEAIVYQGLPFSSSEGATVYNEYLSNRGPNGWETTNLTPRLLEAATLGGYAGFEADLGKGVLFQEAGPPLSPEAPGTFNNLYTQSTTDPLALTPLVTKAPGARSPTGFVTWFAGASSDFTRVFFASDDALTGPTATAPEAPPITEENAAHGEYNLYESHDGELRLVNVLPGNGSASMPARFGAPAVNVTGAAENNAPDLSHAVSDDGSTAFWSSSSGQVYARIDGERTVEIPDPAKFLTASADGSQVLLRDGHVYDLETEQITDLSAGHGGFVGMLGQSEDLSHVYFVDTAVLTGEERNEYGAEAEPGKTNLYGWDEGATTYIATLQPIVGENQAETYGDNTDWEFAPLQRTAEASKNGQWLSFTSVNTLTGQTNNVGTCVFNSLTETHDVTHCAEVFLYDSATHSLRCASCRPTGESPIGASLLPRLPNQSHNTALPQPQFLTDAGRLYFDSQDSLSPFDTNNGFEDVYQYEPDGLGTCTRATGCVSLISAGHEPFDSNFLAVDESGNNVFFTTRDQLVQKDTDDLIDLYDARVGGGIPSQSELPRSECLGESCQPPTPALNDPTPGTSSLEGPGNVLEKKQTHKKKHKRKHSKKHKKKSKAKKHKKRRKSKHAQTNHDSRGAK